jgi:hypothetical protein
MNKDTSTLVRNGKHFLIPPARGLFCLLHPDTRSNRMMSFQMLSRGAR